MLFDNWTFFKLFCPFADQVELLVPKTLLFLLSRDRFLINSRDFIMLQITFLTIIEKHFDYFFLSLVTISYFFFDNFWLFFWRFLFWPTSKITSTSIDFQTTSRSEQNLALLPRKKRLQLVIMWKFFNLSYFNIRGIGTLTIWITGRDDSALWSVNLCVVCPLCKWYIGNVG